MQHILIHLKNVKNVVFNSNFKVSKSYLFITLQKLYVYKNNEMKTPYLVQNHRKKTQQINCSNLEGKFYDTILFILPGSIKFNSQLSTRINNAILVI